MAIIEKRPFTSRSISEFGGHLSYSNTGSTGSGSLCVGGGGVKPSYGYSLGMGLVGSHQSQIAHWCGSGLGAAGGRFGSSFQAGGGRLGLGLASSGGGGSRFGMAWAAGGGGGGGTGASLGTAGSSFAAGGPFVTNEKVELQTLNDRLASYLDKVKRLETANRELEEKLQGFKANKLQVTYDMQAYQNQLQPLRDQLADLLKDCSHLAASIDNTKLAADNFRIKYDNELTVRQMVEGDVAALKALKREYDTSISSLTQEHQILLKDRDSLQSTHQQEVLSLRGQMAGTLTINVQADESVDLSHRLADLRTEYEAIVQKNQRGIENWYTGKLALKDKDTVQVAEITLTQSTEITSSHDQILTLQAELDTLLLKNSYEEQRLVDVQGQKQTQLLALSRLAGGLEGELASVREIALQQSRDYQALLSTKVQLEREIATYKTLLEGAVDLNKIAGVSLPSTTAQNIRVSTIVQSVSVEGPATDVAETQGSAEVQPSSGSSTGEAADVAGTEGSTESQPSSGSNTGEGGGVQVVNAEKAKTSMSSPFDAFLE